MYFNIRKIANNHRLNKEDYKKLRGKIWEFKDHRRRLLCFQTKQGIFVTHGFEKKTNNATPPKEIRRAERLRLYFDGMQQIKRPDSSAKHAPQKSRKRRG